MATDTSWVESMPSIYDGFLGPALFHPFAEHLAAIAADLQPLRVLELAAGTGILTAELVKALPDCAITATDLNDSMVGYGREHVPLATWAQADALRLDQPDDCFDLVACQFGVMFFPDKPLAFAESARVLAPGGTLLFATWDVATASPFPTAMMESLSAVFPDDPPTFIVRVPHGYHDEQQIRSDLEEGGLEPQTVERVVLRGHAASAEALTQGFCLGSPLRFALQERGDLDQLVPALTTEMVNRLGEGPLVAENAAIVVMARPALP